MKKTATALAALRELFLQLKEEIESNLSTDPDGEAASILTVRCMNRHWENAEVEAGLFFHQYDLSTKADPFFTIEELIGKYPETNRQHSMMIGTSDPMRPISPINEDLGSFIPLINSWVSFLNEKRLQLYGTTAEAYRLRQSGKSWPEIEEVLEDKSASGWRKAVKRLADQLELPLRKGKAGRPSKK